MEQLKGRLISKGKAQGEALVTSQPISFYGGIDPNTGIVLETAPAGMVNKECETVVAVGAIISEIPCVDKVDISKIKTGDKIQMENGVLTIF